MHKTLSHIFTFLLATLPLTVAAGEAVAMPYNVPKDSIVAMRAAIANAPKIDDAVYYQNEMNADEPDPAAFELLKYIMQCNAAYHGNLYGVYNWICEDSISARYRAILPADGTAATLPDSTDETQLLRPWYTARMDAASKITDKRIADIIRTMTHLIAYAYTH